MIAALLLPGALLADVVKPALTEISVTRGGAVQIEIRTSVEALLAGIDGRYSNTRDAPNAAQYDRLRKLSPGDLELAFQAFQQTFIDGLRLEVDGKPIALSLERLDIPLPGYTQVPRSSAIYLTAGIPPGSESLSWYYPARYGDHAVRVKQIDPELEQWHWSEYQWIRDDRASKPFSLREVFAPSSRWRVLKTYLEAGFLHILPLGLDHILFILGLFLLSRKLRPLLWQVTMFTLAHSITLSLSMLDIFSLPARLVEPLIALSIAYIALENLFSRELHAWRLWVVFGFGLLHGLGFAAMLAEFGMPRDGFALALLGFNLGVEFGQLTILLLAWFGIGIWFRDPERYRRLVVLPASSLIAMTGLFWFWQRLDWEWLLGLI